MSDQRAGESGRVSWAIEFNWRAGNWSRCVGPFDTKTDAKAWLDTQIGIDHEAGYIRMEAP